MLLTENTLLADNTLLTDNTLLVTIYIFRILYMHSILLVLYPTRFLQIILSDMDECFLQTNNCHEDGSCINSKGSFQCQCEQGYNGSGVVCQGCLFYFFP